MQGYTYTLCNIQWQTKLTMSLLQDISTFDGQDITKLEDWLSDIEMEAHILKESWSCLAEGKLCSFTCTLMCEAIQAGKYWDDIRDILHLKTLQCKHTYLHISFHEIKQRNSEMLAAYVHWFKTEAKRCDFNSDTTTICIFVKGVWDTHKSQQRSMKRTFRPYWRSSN